MRIIAGEWKGRRLKAIRGRKIRPTTDRIREAWMAAVGPEVVGARVLDLFAGSGALGLEALSRGAREAVFVEKVRGAVRVLEQNLELVGAGDRARVVLMDAYRFLDREAGTGEFDLAFADPPYGQGHANRLLLRFLNDPFANALWVEHRSTDSVPASPELIQRRYGDTVLTIATRDE